MTVNGWLTGLLVPICMAAVSLASAQEPATRAEADRRQREEKNQNTKPYQPNALERAMHLVEANGVFVNGRNGFYPKLGSLTTGSGFAFGAGYRRRGLFGNAATLDLWAATSLQRYWATEARLTLPKLAHKRLLLETWVAHRDYPQEDFFGSGPDSLRDNQTSYAIRTNFLGARAGVRPLSMLLTGGGVEYVNPTLGRGKDRQVPSIEERFDLTIGPAIGESIDFVRSTAFVEVDYREPRNARKGGWYRVDFSKFDDRTTARYSFNRIDADVRQYIGFLADRRVIALRLFASTSNTGDDNTMPFYLMPTLGGNDSLRGFRQYRFRGPHAILGQAEYRWEIWSGLDAALFYDAGKVADRRADLNLDALEHDYGFGFRFNTDAGVVFRVDAGFGSRDGKHLYIVFGGNF